MHFVVRCILRASTPERAQWIGHRTEAIATLLVLSQSGSVATQIGPVLRSSGYELIEILSERLLSDADRAAGDIQAALLRVSEGHPVPIAPFEDVRPESAWRECDWAALLASGSPTWAIVDGVSWPEIASIVEQGDVEHRCLYTTLDPQSRTLAPWLIQVTEENGIARRLQARDPATHCFVLLQSPEKIDGLRAHLRRFTMIRTPVDPDAAVYFRFYDPRVLLDMIETLHAGIAAQFMAPLSAVAVPLSPLCLIPEGAALEKGPVAPFDTFDSCRGRLLFCPCDRQETASKGDRRVTEAEFDALSQCMERRAARKLARLLFAAHADSADQQTCLEIASAAKGAADRFGLATVKQVTVFARCQVLFGRNFWQDHPDANQILTDGGLTPWQKKNRLSEWMADASLSRTMTRRPA